jgi:hypothetical protein
MMNKNCIIETCNNFTIKDTQFCEKHYEEYIDILDRLPKDLRKQSRNINILRKNILGVILECSFEINGLDTLIAVATAAAQTTASMVAGQGAESQDKLQYMFKTIFDRAYKRAVDEIKTGHYHDERKRRKGGVDWV